MAERGIVLTYETIRQWCLKFGQRHATALKKRRPNPGDIWHLDEVFLSLPKLTISADLPATMKGSRPVKPVCYFVAPYIGPFPQTSTFCYTFYDATIVDGTIAVG